MINNSIYFFVIGSFFGWMLEILFKLISGEKNPKAGLATGPFCVLYGIGTFILALIIFKYTNNNLIIFILSVIVLTSLEYITGLLLDKVYGIELWNYSKLKFGINKYISIEFMLIWGILGILFVKYLVPTLNKIYYYINSQSLVYIYYIILIYIIFDYSYASISLLNKKKITSKN